MIQVQDKVIFLVNNLSGNNLEAKAKELKAILTSETYPWFANYMVVKRAAQEANFHHLYLQVSTPRLLATMIQPYWNLSSLLLDSCRYWTFVHGMSVESNTFAKP